MNRTVVRITLARVPTQAEPRSPTAIVPTRAAFRARSKQTHRAGFTMVEAAVVLSVSGMVLVVAVPTFIDELESSKAAEATGHLETLFQRSAAYYAVARPTLGEAAAHCLPAPAGPTPPLPSATPVPVDFTAEDVAGVSTWRALGFAPRAPLRYRYTLVVQGPVCLVVPVTPAPTLILRAEGDLDGDGIYSRLERRARLGGGGQLQPERVLRIYDRIE